MSSHLKTSTKIDTRSGTGNEGKVYEQRLAALFSLRCSDFGTENMWIKFNANKCGVLDDFVIYRKDRATKINHMYAIQVKHSLSPKVILPGEVLRIPNKENNYIFGNYSLPHYASTYKKMLNTDHPMSTMFKEMETTCILYTNNIIQFLHPHDWPSKDNQKELPKNEKPSRYCDFLQIVETHPLVNICNTADESIIYKIDYTKLQEYYLFKNLPEDHKTLLNENFTKRFLLFSQQVKFDKVEPFIVKQIEDMLNFEHTSRNVVNEVMQKYVHFIDSWTQGNVIDDYCLTKEDIIAKLTELLLIGYNYISTFYKGTRPCDCTDYQIYTKKWHSLIQNKHITIINVNRSLDTDEEVRRFLYCYMYTEIEKNIRDKSSLKELNWEEHFPSGLEKEIFDNKELNREKQIAVGKHGKVTLSRLYSVLWKLKKVPLLVEIKTEEEYKNLLHILRLSNYCLKVIILNKIETNNDQYQFPLLENSQPEPFTCFEQAEECMQNEILQNNVNFQGNIVVLKNLVETNKINISWLTTKDIIKIFIGSFTFGGQLTNRMPMYYIRRNF